jgi:hypothetical protein
MRPPFLGVLGILLVAGSAFGPGRAEAQPTAAGDASRARPGTAGSDLETVAPLRGLPVEQERDPGRGPTAHEPVFLEPAATTTEHVRLGLSAWIAPGAPFDHRESPGGPAVGFTITWPPPVQHAPTAGPSPWRGSAAR